MREPQDRGRFLVLTLKDTEPSPVFWDCKALQRIVIPATVTNIGACVFEGCDSLTIVGYAKSKAEKYAKDNRIAFECINDK